MKETAMVFAAQLKGKVELEIEDLYLLEPFQIGYLPRYAPERELAAVLWAHPSLRCFLVKKCPSLRRFVEDLMARYGPAATESELAQFGQRLVWRIDDLLIYNKCPEAYDTLAFHAWDVREVTGIAPLDGKVVIDAGAGTGRVTLEAAQSAQHVFAVEPVGRLRRFIREKAVDLGLENVFPLDGFLHSIPVPDDFADVLITSHALGWSLEEELCEFERVVKPRGAIIHCPGTADAPREEERHRRLVSSDWQYAFARYEAPDGWKRKYWKRV